MKIHDAAIANISKFRHIVKNFFSIGMSQALTSLMAFGINILMANKLPGTVFGTYKFLLSWVSVLSISSLPQTQYTYGNAVARGKSGGYGEIVWKKIKFGLIGTAIALAMSAYYLVKDNSVLSLSFFVIGILIPFLDPSSLFNGYFQGSREYARNAKLVVIQSIITYLSIIAVFLWTQSVPVLIGSYIIAWVLPRLHISLKLYKQHKNSESDASEVVRYGKQLTMYDSLLYITQFVDKLALFYIVGAREVAVYTIATAFPDQIKSYVKNIYFMLQARFATSTFSRAFSNTKKITGISIVVLIGVTILYALFAPLLIRIFFPDYADAVFISIIYSLSIISAVYTIPSLAMRANNKEKELLKINMFRGITYCILVIFGTKFFGMIGAVIGKVIGDYIYATSYYVMMFKISKTQVILAEGSENH